MYIYIYIYILLYLGHILAPITSLSFYVDIISTIFLLCRSFTNPVFEITLIRINK